ncbi:hypothetical protein D3105_07405 [Streptomyces globisporus]|uniref:Uncharacterized protein n=1 Tax=Streptomyces globisporus TaxID=1908 RepID=A0A423V3G1_STRGL|nr:hypothetical protein D3105_07405 [Streptomyces globisporus]
MLCLLFCQTTPRSSVAAMPLYTWCTGRSPSCKVQVSTSSDHSSVHMPMHEQMHVHAGCSFDYKTNGAPISLPLTGVDPCGPW